MENTKDKDFFQFRRLYELQKGDVFKIREKGVFYFIIGSWEDSVLFQTLFGKKRTIVKRDKGIDIEVLYYPNTKCGIDY